ncbi:Protein of unknown function [Bacillus cytotoxicus]|nr:Protein of unknown function [Bacillus cytotoxicus]
MPLVPGEREDFEFYLNVVGYKA